MSEDRRDIEEAVTAISADLCTPDHVRASEARGWNAELWQVLAESGFTRVSLPEEAGGSGGDVDDACTVLRVLGACAGAVPVAESSLVAGWALTRAGLELPPGPVTSAVGHRDDELTVTDDGSGGARVSGRLHRVPWAEQADGVVVVADGRVLHLERAGLEVTAGRNLAGESRDTVVLDDVRLDASRVATAPDGVDAETLRVRGALARAAAGAGAMGRASALTVRYTSEREQFGRPLARFQAVQRHVVRVAERAQEALVAAETAARNAGSGDPDPFDVACAKVLLAESGRVVTQAAHQAHGAIGMTKEYELGQVSRRLWAWREEWGSDVAWSRWLGHHVAAGGGEGYWPAVSRGLVATSGPAA